MAVLLLLLVMTMCPDALLEDARRVRDQYGRTAEIRHLRTRLAGCEPDARMRSAVAQRFAEAARESRKPDLLTEAYHHGREGVRLAPRSSYAHEILSEVFAIDLEMSSLVRKAVLSDSVRIHAELALRYDPRNEKALFTLGRWHVEVANLPWYAAAARAVIVRDLVESTNPIAIGYLERAVALEPTDEFRYWLGVAYARDGQRAAAERQWSLLREPRWVEAAARERRSQRGR